MKIGGHALFERGIFFVAVLDGDKSGRDSRDLLMKRCNGISADRIILLDKILHAEQNPTVESLFSAPFKTNYNVKVRGLQNVIADIEKGSVQIDDETLRRFSMVFQAINRIVSGLPC